MRFYDRRPQRRVAMVPRHRALALGLVVASVLVCCAVPALAVPLSPDSVAGLQAWYKVDDGVGTSGAAVTDWADRGPSGYDMSQGNSSYQPTMVTNQAGVTSRWSSTAATTS